MGFQPVAFGMLTLQKCGHVPNDMFLKYVCLLRELRCGNLTYHLRDEFFISNLI